MKVDLRLFAKPGKEGQIFVSLDSLILFLREEARVPDELEHVDALNSVADVLEGELEGIKKQRAVISDVFGVGGVAGAEIPRGGSTS